ncbi:hypothetical protein P280DRAFT_192694 [Massarina eburnea CBS 473.64]|uniref:Uncharacterized protein n=1 Tax=Massarina eburnea CBS 473.64 TaxID=1395130 RepID=A0A6A6RIW2_9PLEO|nr:hypothetical protein P280DRAFT_192694 [Massarina eburnea CBS 473.64]
MQFSWLRTAFSMVTTCFITCYFVTSVYPSTNSSTVYDSPRSTFEIRHWYVLYACYEATAVTGTLPQGPIDNDDPNVKFEFRREITRRCCGLNNPANRAESSGNVNGCLRVSEHLDDEEDVFSAWSMCCTETCRSSLGGGRCGGRSSEPKYWPLYSIPLPSKSSGSTENPRTMGLSDEL